MAGPSLPETSLAHLRILIRWFRQQTGEAAQAKKAGRFTPRPHARGFGRMSLADPGWRRRGDLLPEGDPC